MKRRSKRVRRFNIVTDRETTFKVLAVAMEHTVDQRITVEIHNGISVAEIKCRPVRFEWLEMVIEQTFGDVYNVFLGDDLLSVTMKERA